jgi:hypothetical protein
LYSACRRPHTNRLTKHSPFACQVVLLQSQVRNGTTSHAHSQNAQHDGHNTRSDTTRTSIQCHLTAANSGQKPTTDALKDDEKTPGTTRRLALPILCVRACTLPPHAFISPPFSQPPRIFQLSPAASPPTSPFINHPTQPAFAPKGQLTLPPTPTRSSADSDEPLCAFPDLLQNMRTHRVLRNTNMQHEAHGRKRAKKMWRNITRRVKTIIIRMQ